MAPTACNQPIRILVLVCEINSICTTRLQLVGGGVMRQLVLITKALLCTSQICCLQGAV